MPGRYLEIVMPEANPRRRRAALAALTAAALASAALCAPGAASAASADAQAVPAELIVGLSPT